MSCLKFKFTSSFKHGKNSIRSEQQKSNLASRSESNLGSIGGKRDFSVLGKPCPKALHFVLTDQETRISALQLFNFYVLQLFHNYCFHIFFSVILVFLTYTAAREENIPHLTSSRRKNVLFSIDGGKGNDNATNEEFDWSKELT